MKRNSLNDYLTFTSVKLLSSLFIALPTPAADWLGRLVGYLGYYLDFKHRAVAYNNIKRAFADKKDPRQINKIVKQCFVNFSENFVELLRLPLINNEYIAKYIKLENKEYIRDALSKGKGLIIMAVHFGSWELANAVCASLDYPYKIIARQQDKSSRLDDLLNSYRQQKEETIISRGSQTREIIRSLQTNGIMGIVIDQGGRFGMPIKFFGNNASVHTGALRLAFKFDTPLMMAYIIREKGPYHKILLQRISLEETGHPHNDVKNNLDKIIKSSQEMISQYPEQYHWFYKVWKYSNERSIVVLSDNKTGHLRQAEAVAGMIARGLLGRGLNAQIQIIEVVYKNNLSKVLLNILIFILTRHFFYRRVWPLKYFLAKDSYDTLKRVTGDFIVSCGSSAVAMNLILSAETKAKSIAILKPGIFGYRRFNLCIVPKHDTPPARKNIAATLGALSQVNNEYLESQSKLLIERFSFLAGDGKKRIGIFIGGETKDYTLDSETITQIIDDIKAISDSLDTEILFSTSRRTPPHIEGLLKSRLGNYSRCKLGVIANESNYPEAVGGILGLCDVIVLSSDSISMISEAASSGKTVVVFKIPPKTKGRDNKRHKKFLNNLSQGNHIILTNPKDAQEAIKQAVKNRKTEILGDSEGVFKAVQKIL